MRFISKYAKYMLNVRRDITEHYATGQSKLIQRPLVATFEIGLVTGDERALARDRFSFNGFSQEADMVTIVEPDARISAYDTRLAQQQNDWTDEERKEVEAALLKAAQQLPGDLIMVEEVRLAPPWPTYDSYSGSVESLLIKIEDDGYDFAAVLAYELENQNRAEITFMLGKAIEHNAGSDRVVEEEMILG